MLCAHLWHDTRSETQRKERVLRRSSSLKSDSLSGFPRRGCLLEGRSSVSSSRARFGIAKRRFRCSRSWQKFVYNTLRLKGRLNNLMTFQRVPGTIFSEFVSAFAPRSKEISKQTMSVGLQHRSVDRRIPTGRTTLKLSNISYI